MDHIAPRRCPNQNSEFLMQKATCNCTQFHTEKTNCTEARVLINWTDHPNETLHWNEKWTSKNLCPAAHGDETTMMLYDYYLTCAENFRVPSEE